LHVLEQISRLCMGAGLIETECIVDDPRNVAIVQQGPRGQVKLTPTIAGFMQFIEADELDGDGSNGWVSGFATESVGDLLSNRAA
jgi:hypothetical protein